MLELWVSQMMDDLVMMITLSLAVLVAILMMGHSPVHFDPRWISAATGGVAMVVLWYIAVYLYHIQNELRALRQLFTIRDVQGKDVLNPTLRGTIQRLLGIVKEVGK